MDSESVAGLVAGVIGRRQDPAAPWPKPHDMEFKSAAKGLPESFWTTYSAFANSDGGFIVLGVSRDGDGFVVSGVGDTEGIIRGIRDGLHDRGRVSVDLIRGGIRVAEVDGKDLVILEVPRAERHLRPVYVNGRVEDGTFRRGPRGDYLCTLDEVDSIVRDSRAPIDGTVLDRMGIRDLDEETVLEYRSALRSADPDSALNGMGMSEFLRAIGAMDPDGGEGLTVAGLLMFGRNDRTLRWNHDFHLAYMECLDDGPDWDYRLSTRDTTWVGNIYGFLGRALRRIQRSAGAATDAYAIIEEALLNALMNADYGGSEGVCVTRRPGILTVWNSGDFRIPPEAAESGGCSDPRNPHIARMLGLMGMAGLEGTGVCRILSAWRDAGLGRPEYTFEYGPPRVVLRFGLPSLAE